MKCSNGLTVPHSVNPLVQGILRSWENTPDRWEFDTTTRQVTPRVTYLYAAQSTVSPTVVYFTENVVNVNYPTYRPTTHEAQLLRDTFLKICGEGL